MFGFIAVSLCTTILKSDVLRYKSLKLEFLCTVPCKLNLIEFRCYSYGRDLPTSAGVYLFKVGGHPSGPGLVYPLTLVRDD